MTKEEIQKNSEHWYNKYKDAEKRMAELENENKVLAQNLEDSEIIIVSLKAQIEKMKRCATCKYSTDLGYCKIRCSGGECDNHNKWELDNLGENENDRT